MEDGGTGMTINKIKNDGHWVIHYNVAVKPMISKCVD